MGTDDLTLQVMGDRYQVIRELGQGGFGHTYLAADMNRFNETCVLKELAPSGSNQDNLEKAKELFAREAEVLYRLEHPQIPRFREWFIEPTRQSMFLVQDYVEGPTYQDILRDRQKQQQTFTESEVLALFWQILPVLSYIHGKGVIHRDLSPDNLICRNRDHLPVLIDFGGVKQVTISAMQSQKTANPVTLIGKPGYSPDEQMRQGIVSASSDLYALGVTAMVLMSGQEPAAFYDAYNLKFDWRSRCRVSSGFANLLDKLVAGTIADRYPSVEAVIADLEGLAPVQGDRPASGTEGWSAPVVPMTGGTAPAPNPRFTESGPTMVVSPAGTAMATAIAANPHAPIAHAVSAVPQGSPFAGVGDRVLAVPRLLWAGTRQLLQFLLVLGLLIGMGALGWSAVRWWLLSRPSAPFSPEPDTSTQAPPAATTYSVAEQQRKAQLLERLEQSRISENFFYRLVNEAYYLKYPDQQGRLLGRGAEDAPLRANWDALAADLLAFGEGLSPGSQGRLGQFNASDRQQWNQTLRRRQINPRTFEADVQRELGRSLTVYRNIDLTGEVAQQLLYGLMADRIAELNEA